MVFNKAQRKIKQLNHQPEEVRIRAATSMTIVIGIVLAVICLAVLLPLQMYLMNPNKKSIQRIRNLAGQTGSKSEQELSSPGLQAKDLLNIPKVGGLIDSP